MSSGLRAFLFFVVPIVGVIMFPPATIISSLPVVIFAIIAFIGLGLMEWQGRKWALTLSIFLQGFNVIIRLMMFVANAVPDTRAGTADITFIITSLIAIALSMWILLRLDKVDVQRTMIR